MITERGKVSEIEQGQAWVECQSRASCERCASGQGCGGGVLGALLGDRLRKVRARAQSHVLRVGDQVELGMSASALLGGALLVYLLPLSGLLLGAIASGLLAGFSNDLITVGGGLAGLVAGVLVSRRLHRGNQTGLQPEVLRVLGPCEEYSGPSSTRGDTL